jgi:hypothetical protein
MKTLILCLLLVVVLVPVAALTGCTRERIDENNPENTRVYEFTDFTDIEVSDAFDVEITRSNTYKVVVNAPESALKRIRVHKSGSTLTVDTNWWWFFHWTSRPRLTITLPELKLLELSGASHGEVSGFKSSTDFELSMGGASELDIDMEVGKLKADISGASTVNGNIKATESNIDLSGASRINLEGSGGDTSLSASGASRASLADFSVDDADIDLSGASEATVNVAGKMNVELSGSSTLRYSGSPALGKMDISGSSHIEQK